MPNPPKNMACIRKPDRTVIKPRRVFWDVFNLLGAFWLTFYLLILTAAAFNYARIERLVGSPYKTALIFGIAVVIAVLLLGMMFKKDKIVLKGNKLILVHKFLFLSRKEYADLSRIKDIQVAYNPATDRYYLSIITDDNMLAFGKSIPIQDLQWTRDFIIYSMTR